MIQSNVVPPIISGHFKGTTLSTRTDEYKAELIHDFDLASRDHFESGKLKPILDRTFKFSDIVRGKL